MSVRKIASQPSAGQRRARGALRFMIPLLIILAAAALVARADDFTRGRLTAVSVPSPLAGCAHSRDWTDGTNHSEVETHLVVNPRNPRNIVAIWIAHDFSGNVVSVTFDGGTTWRNVAIPGISVCTGGISANGADPWISFAPDGVLYASSLAVDATNVVYVSRSTDGGLIWSSPVPVSGGADADRPSITADPGNSSYVYAVWNTGIFGGRATTEFTRTTDGGQSWEPSRSIYVPPAGNAVWDEQIMVLPNGTLVCVFTELIQTGVVNSIPQYDYALSVQRSTNKGQTWSAPVQVVAQQPRTDPNPNDLPFWATVTDPNNGRGIESPGNGHSVSIDPDSGNLYAVWMDARFSGGQYNSIAFSQSTDGGKTWSDPIPVNQTPNNAPAATRQAWCPTVAVAGDGTIGVSYYDLRFDTPGHGCRADYWLVQCTPESRRSATNPANWEDESRLTQASFDVQHAPTVDFGGDAAYWFGDYQGLAGVGDGFAAVWTQPYGGSPDHILFRRVEP